jgi:hypothetical protein
MNDQTNPIADLASRHAVLVAYLNMKVEQADWHGVSDAANDLRVLEETMRLT